ncbi:MAG: hypothetical protein U0R52_04050 [Solirubrobacterales bacterium]
MAAGAAIAALALAPSGASAACGSSGGITPSGNAACAPVGKARLVNGKAIAPANAPARVKAAIAAANRIRNKPYIWGGGHAGWEDAGYDCSGSVSYALHGGGFLSSPLPSGPMESWGWRGKGRWITVYANAGHAYAVIAGLRWDTSMTPGNGPGWSKQMRPSAGFVSRHPGGY